LDDTHRFFAGAGFADNLETGADVDGIHLLDRGYRRRQQLSKAGSEE
jgi:hypothetical protein